LTKDSPANIVNQIKKCAVPSLKATLQCDHAIHQCLKDFRGFSVDARFVVYNYPSKTSNDFYGFLVHDVFNDKERYSKLQKSPGMEIRGFILFNADFGLYIEDDEEFLSVNLVELDWANEKMRVVQMIRLPLEAPASFMYNPSDSRFIFINTVQPAGAFVQIYKFENDEIVLEHSNFIEAWPIRCASSFFDGK